METKRFTVDTPKDLAQRLIVLADESGVSYKEVFVHGVRLLLAYVDARKLGKEIMYKDAKHPRGVDIRILDLDAIYNVGVLKGGVYLRFD